MFVIVSYDVSEDKRRNKIAKKLKDFGERVQKSVFECNLDEEKIKQLVKTVVPLLDEEEDTLRIYKVCKECKKKTEIYGNGDLTEDVEVYII
jgi:CRISPR-associated protein Cas2